jgi:cellulose synthase/poly-beta-1,6-N-acetylglucosamine synthase-like glycosyltransferase
LRGLNYFVEAWQFLFALPESSYFALFWLTFLFEAPRYFLGMQTTAAALLLHDTRRSSPIAFSPQVSILLVGHCEESAIEKCVRSLFKQTFSKFEIVCVDDGSTDATFGIMSRLRREGLVQTTVRLDLRGGKASAINLAASLAKGDIYVVVDCDCSFEFDAIEELLRPLVENSEIAAVSGNILVRNWRNTITTSLQAIEYITSISLGKSYSDVLDQISCVSGAFGAFRANAWNQVGGMDIGGGEDLDFTIRLRLAGYRVVFARKSICYTDVPESLYALLRQRSRWERDSFWLRMRKYGRIFNPLNSRFSWRDALHQWDCVLFSMLTTLTFPFYLVWLLARYGEFGITLLLAVSMALVGLDLAVFFCAVLVTGKPVYWRLLPFLPLFGLFQCYIMRLHRFYAYVTEWIYSSSLKDNYVPQKVRDWSTWR